MTLFYLYSVVFIVFSVISFFFIDPNFIYLRHLYTGASSLNRLPLTVIYVILISFLFLIHYFILKRASSLDLKKIKKILIVPLIGVLSYPAMLSYDIFNYIATAKVMFFRWENPYLVMPIEFINDPVLLFTRAANKIALYGPAWILVTGLPFILSLGNYLISIVLLKILVCAFFFGALFIIWKLTKNYYSVLFLGTNPLVVVETFLSGHNDIVMMFFALLSIYSLKNKKIVIAVACLLISILIKYATIFLVPLFIYYIYQRLRRKQINWDRFYLLGFFLMFGVFLLSPLREELYPWYSIWFIVFATLIPSKIIKTFVVFLSLGMMLRYIPYMYVGDYLNWMPGVKSILTIAPTLLFLIYLWLKKSFRALL